MCKSCINKLSLIYVFNIVLSGYFSFNIERTLKRPIPLLLPFEEYPFLNIELIFILLLLQEFKITMFKSSSFIKDIDINFS
ncbi:hypothetical protein AXF41_03975 [Clostridium haemolyticum]|nr:hypothetical protein AXF41_03975 [Clostridium haemolyticum]